MRYCPCIIRYQTYAFTIWSVQTESHNSSANPLSRAMEYHALNALITYAEDRLLLGPERLSVLRSVISNHVTQLNCATASEQFFLECASAWQRLEKAVKTNILDMSYFAKKTVPRKPLLVITDIHGNFDYLSGALKAGITASQELYKQDPVIVTLGDYVDNGSQVTFLLWL